MNAQIVSTDDKVHVLGVVILLTPQICLPMNVIETIFYYLSERISVEKGEEVSRLMVVPVHDMANMLIRFQETTIKIIW